VPCGRMAMPTPMVGEGTLVEVMPLSMSPMPTDAGTTTTESPVLIFIYFHKPIRVVDDERKTNG
jgi:zinc finger protein-like protein